MIHAKLMDPARASVVVSAHREDAAWVQRFRAQLPVDRDRLDLWDEERFAAAPEALETALGSARAVVLLLSPSWLRSRFATGGELERALRARGSDLLVLPVRVEACAVEGTAWLARPNLRPTEPALPSVNARRQAVEAALRDVARECAASLRAAARRPARSFEAQPADVARATVLEPPGGPLARHTPALPASTAATLQAERHALVALLRARAVARPSTAPPPTRRELPRRPRGGTRQAEVARESERPTRAARKAMRKARRWEDLEPATHGVPPPPVGSRFKRRLVQGLIALGIGYALFHEYAQRVDVSDTLPIPTADAPPIPAANAPPLPEGVTERPYVSYSVRLDAQRRVWQRTARGVSAFSESLADGVILELVALRGGTFSMGSAASEAGRFVDEGPQHRVTLAPFALGKFEVTQAQWAALAALPRLERDLVPQPAAFPGDDRPVESIAWHDAVEFCARLARHTGRPYRLPSEAEWEFAARAGSQSPWAYGEALTPEVAHYASDANGWWARRLHPTPESTAEVGGPRLANAFGLYDMHGNVWEWTLDPWHDTYEGAPGDGSAWTLGGDASLRVRRGGAWDGQPLSCRSALRSHASPDSKSHSTGFRVALSLDRPHEEQ